MNHKNYTRDESGIVSIIVTMVLMVVVTLIVIGFSQIASREQRQALDRQLSTQANYAAESGINDAIQAIQKDGLTGNKSTCNDPTNLVPTTSNVGSPSGLTSYTCLLIDQTPSTLEYSDISTQTSSNILFGGEVSGIASDIKTIEIWWNEKNGSNSFVPGGTQTFKSISSWLAGTGTGVLRVSTTGILSGPNAYSRGSLQAYTSTAFLYPNQVVSSTHNITFWDYKKSGAILNGGCSVVPGRAKYCMSKIIFNPVGPNYPKKVFLNLKSIYADSAVTIKAFNSSNQLLNLVGAQAKIDSTGKANDVLRRLQVRVPLNNSYTWPPGAVQSLQGLCKLYNIAPINPPSWTANTIESGDIPAGSPPTLCSL